MHCAGLIHPPHLCLLNFSPHKPPLPSPSLARARKRGRYWKCNFSHIQSFILKSKLDIFLFPTLFLVFTSLLLQLLLPLLLSRLSTTQVLVNMMSMVRLNLTILLRTDSTVHLPLQSKKLSPLSSTSSTMVRPTPSTSKAHSDHLFLLFDMLFLLPLMLFITLVTK